MSGALGRSEKVAEQLARRILEEVVANDTRTGTILPAETAMMERFQVSRSSVREALRILEVYGLLRVRTGPKGGPVVAGVGARDFGRTASFYLRAMRTQFVELLEARLLLEPLMAREAAKSLDDGGRERLTTNIQAARAHMEKAGPEWSYVMNEFHLLIYSLSGNRILDLMGCALTNIHNDRVTSIFEVGSRQPVFDAHVGIAEAILAGDVDRSEQLTRAHIDELLENMKIHDPGVLREMIEWH